jgi:hypothetical protein
VQPLLTQHWEDRLQLAKNPHLSKKVHLELLTDALRIAPTHYLGVVYDYLCNLVGRPLPADLIPQVVTALATYSTMPYTQLQLLEFLQHNPLSTKDLLTLAPCKLSIETRGYLYHTYATNHEFQKASLSYYRPDLSVTAALRLGSAHLTVQEAAYVLQQAFENAGSLLSESVRCSTISRTERLALIAATSTMLARRPAVRRRAQELLREDSPPYHPALRELANATTVAPLRQALTPTLPPPTRTHEQTADRMNDEKIKLLKEIEDVLATSERSWRAFFDLLEKHPQSDLLSLAHLIAALQRSTSATNRTPQAPGTNRGTLANL